jgi:hypothetical protein
VGLGWSKPWEWERERERRKTYIRSLHMWLKCCFFFCEYIYIYDNKAKNEGEKSLLGWKSLSFICT